MYGLVVNSDIARRMGGFDEQFTVSEDKDFIIRLVSSGFRFHPIEEVLINIYYHGKDHLSTNTNLEIKLANEITLFNKNKDFICQNKYIILNHKNCLLNYFYNAGDYKNARKILLEILRIEVSRHAIEKFLRFEVFHRIKKWRLFIKKIYYSIITLIMLIIFSIAIYASIIFFSYKDTIITLDLSNPSTTSLMQYRHFSVPITQWISYDKIPKIAIEALLVAEDIRFFKHTGFDYKAIKNALFYNIKHTKIIKGASTITQQLAKNLFLTPERTFQRKFEEAIIAIGLEYFLEKERIFELYVNVIEFGYHIFGIENAALHYFNKPFSQLDNHEIIMLISIIPNPLHEKPYKYSQSSFERSISIIENLKHNNILTEQEYTDTMFSLVLLNNDLYHQNLNRTY